MKVISIGTDRKIFEQGSAVLSRSVEYASKMEEMHVIVYSLKHYDFPEMHVGNLHVYSTASSNRLLYAFDAYMLGKSIVEKNKMQEGETVITSQDPFETGIAAYFLHLRFNFPFQLQLHTDLWSSYFKKSYLNKIRFQIAQYLLPRAQAVRVVSKSVAQVLKKNWGVTKVSVLPIFVDTLRIIQEIEKTVDLRKEFPQFQHIVLMASRLTVEKNIQVALTAMKKVIQKKPKTGLLIVGSGPEEKNLKNFIKSEELTKNVKFLGWKDDLLPYYKSADIFLLTSEYEGYGMTLVEAAAAGVPIITTEVGIAGSLPFKSGSNSFVCDVGDVTGLSKAILDLIKNEEKRKLFKERMQDSIKSEAMTREEYMVKYVGLLEEMLSYK